jgi:hypoxanthine phosphoribosyltransferase
LRKEGLSLDITFEVPTWDEIYDLLLGLADKIRKDSFHPDIIVGILRGGCTPARVIADLLGNLKLAEVGVEFYVGTVRAEGEPVLTQPVSISVEGRNVLLLDDVVDTGKSLQLVKDHIVASGAKKVKTAAIYFKPWSIIVPDYYEKKTRIWVVFPWEQKETVKCLVINCKKEGIPIDKASEKLVKSGMNKRLVKRFIYETLKEEQG